MRVCFALGWLSLVQTWRLLSQRTVFFGTKMLSGSSGGSLVPSRSAALLPKY